MKKTGIFFVFFSFLILPISLFATHERAAEIIYHHVSGLTYEINLISYTFTPSPANAYRDNLTIDWGDGTKSDIPRVQITHLPNDIQYNLYIGQHTFPGPSTYIISCEDPNRNGGILNIPNSINIPMYIYSELTINPFTGYCNSPILLIPPVDNGCVGEPFYHNPGAYDPDGDSLSYKLVTCLGSQGLPIPGYTLPPATHSIHLDSITGDFFWDSPPQQGEYNIAILIEKWRNGIVIGSVLRDMQIIIVACDNHPPVIQIPADTCVEAGKTLTFPVHAYDPDSDQVTLTGTGGPFILSNSPATLIPNPAVGKGHVTGLFYWPTVCGHVIKQPYRTFFKAQDNSTPVQLVDITSLRIRVVGPAPAHLTASALGTTITLRWDNYSCQNATGYLVYRKADSTGWVHGYCETGVPPYLGYTQIDQLSDITRTTYTDDNHGIGLSQGIKYCYLLVAYYGDKAESYASNEACAELKKDVPVITNVSVTETSTTSGSIYLAWSKPTQIDTTQAPGPYEYIVKRASLESQGAFVPIDSLFNLNDTILTDQHLNTLTHPFIYKIDLVNLTPGNRFLIGSSQQASSIFLQITPTDRKLKLRWNNDMPWTNYRFDIFRRDPGSTVLDSIGTTLLPAYDDKNLINGDEYCYKIRSIGKYSAGGYVDPIVNFSQVSCAIPVDNIPPCPPILHVTTDCQQSLNILIWTNRGDTCGRDIAKYYIYYSPALTGPLSLIDSILHPEDTIYQHKPDLTIAGCYVVIAIDSVGNHSDLSNQVCIDITACPTYSLPNVFTPNGDGKNDFFEPFPYTSVEEIDLSIFDRWGKKVYQTHDPKIHWDGKDMTTGLMCSDGVYFYICDVYELTLTGRVKRNLHGSVTILH